MSNCTPRKPERNVEPGLAGLAAQADEAAWQAFVPKPAEMAVLEQMFGYFTD